MVEGLIQGVGFRPFVYRLAKKHHLSGNVSNRTDGVVLNIYGDEKKIDVFTKEIELLAPPAAEIKNIHKTFIDDFFSDDFYILPSKSIDDHITEISPDIAVCDDCLNDIKNQQHRLSYPFINCTNCGPRFSIIKSLPYDRSKTTMDKFEMCPICNSEYYDVDDRRFHAQPVACANCGPEYHLNNISDFNLILGKVTSSINNGGIIAIKGFGGYNLICDANNEIAVQELREIKGRDTKPFAVMFPDLETVQTYCYLSKEEKEILESWRKPIVLLKEKKQLARQINSGLPSIGAILPYLPFHYLLFEKLKSKAIVYTSANISGEPIIWDDKKASLILENNVTTFVNHNRDIENPIDDSVIKVVNNKNQIIRRARGYVPNPIVIRKNVEGIFAAGAELKNCFCIGKGKNAILSQHVGDLKNLETYNFYKSTVTNFFDLFKFKIKAVACDLHPDYLSTQFSEGLVKGNLNGNQIPIIKVQHHHAHIVSGMAENQIKGKVLGVSFDGTGYGVDGNIWGGEFLVCDTKSFERFAHFDYIKMPGGDRAAEEPWRMALSYLHNYSLNKGNKLEYFKDIENNKIKIVTEMLQNNINTPLTSSAGRLFDTVACILNLCSKNSFDAEGPMRLESIIDESEKRHYPFTFNNGVISFEETINRILGDLNKLSGPKISAKFHNTMVNVICELVNKMRKETGINKVVLSGGVFQNKYLLENTIYKLKENKFETFTNHLVPPNDGGIALGQLLIASNYM